MEKKSEIWTFEKYPVLIQISLCIVNQSNVCFRGILLAEEQRYSEAVRSYENAIHFRPRLAGEKYIIVFIQML